MAPAAVEGLAVEPVTDRAAGAASLATVGHGVAARLLPAAASILGLAYGRRRPQSLCPDGAALAGERRIWIWLLELLLFLSAMLAGLTGLISGDRAVEARQVERTAVAASAAVDPGAKAAEAAARIVIRRDGTGRVHPAPAPSPALAALELPQAAPVDERRLE